MKNFLRALRLIEINFELDLIKPTRKEVI